MIEARFRRRADLEPITEIHSVVMACLKQVAWLWKNSNAEIQLDSNGESAACDLTPFLRSGVNGAISYSARFPNSMKDEAIFDDVLTLQICDGQYCEFVNDVFAKIVSCFKPYRANTVLDIDLDLDDFEEIVATSEKSGLDIDGRDSVYRINPVNFFDEELCQRSFHRSKDEIQRLLMPEVENVELMNDGILIVVTSKIILRDQLLAMHNKIAAVLGLPNES